MTTTTEGRARVAVVTGGSRGIGRAVVEALLDDGWRVWFFSRSEESVERALVEIGERLADEAGSDGTGSVDARAVDVRDQAAVERFFAEVVDAEGRIDLLVNNAGLGRFGPVDRLSGDEWREVLGTNLDGVFYCLRAAAPVLRRQGEGTIVNVASLAARNAFAGGAAYNASKYGLLGLTEAAMLDLRHDGVRVVAVLPGSVDTAFDSPGGPREDTSWMLRPGDVARAVVDVLGYPSHALPSRIELRPTRPKKG